MSDQLIALVVAAATAVGAIVGAIASPVGKDWVARKAEGRAADARKAAAIEARQAQLAEERRQTLHGLRDAVAEAMTEADHFRNTSSSAARRAGEGARQRAVGFGVACQDEALRALVDKWAETYVGASRSTTAAQVALLDAAHHAVLDKLGQVLRSETGTPPV